MSWVAICERCGGAFDRVEVIYGLDITCQGCAEPEELEAFEHE